MIIIKVHRENVNRTEIDPRRIYNWEFSHFLFFKENKFSLKRYLKDEKVGEILNSLPTVYLVVKLDYLIVKYSLWNKPLCCNVIGYHCGRKCAGTAEIGIVNQLRVEFVNKYPNLYIFSQIFIYYRISKFSHQFIYYFSILQNLSLT